MEKLMRYKYWFFGISLLVILPGLFSLAKWGLNLSIDFTGGTVGSEIVGPVIGKELTVNSVKAVIFASLAIILYLAYTFRNWRFGICAVTALLHDVLVVVGVFSLLGHFYNIKIDALFVTALLTIIGFSVHDTIVVFDRIRENLQKAKGSFEEIVDKSIYQTLGRSIRTSLTVLFTLLALIIFGGETIRWFAVALFIGIFSGTYSSIFNAAPLLVIWEEHRRHSGGRP